MVVSVKPASFRLPAEGVQQWPYKQALPTPREVIPAIAQNVGASPIRVRFTPASCQHVEGHTTWGLMATLGKLPSI